MIGVRLFPILIVIIIAAFAGSNSYAQSACPAFPKVSWWNGLSHESTEAAVQEKFNGNWNYYANAWKQQLVKLRKIHGKGSTALIKNKAAKGKKVRLRGAKLKAYIGNVQQRLAVIRCLAKQADAPRPVEPPRQVVKKIGAETAKASVCMQCHGDRGISINPTIPNLAGQNKFYMVKQLKEFQADLPPEGHPFGAAVRHSRIMTGQVKNLTNENVWVLASFFSALPSCPAGEKKLGVIEAAKRTPPKSARQCAQCHNPKLAGATPGTPILDGQKQDYLLRQLNAFRTSADHKNLTPSLTKEKRYHFLMSEMAKSLKKAELNELAKYYSGKGCS